MLKYQKGELSLKSVLSAFFRVKEYWWERKTQTLHVIVRTFETERQTNPAPALMPIAQAMSGFLGFKYINAYQLGFKKWHLVFETDEPKTVVGFLLEWEDSCIRTLKKYGLLKPNGETSNG